MKPKTARHTHTAGGVVLNAKGKVLIVNQRGNSWSLPKGHLEQGEDALAAAVREIYEEAGVRKLKLIKPLGSYKRYKIGKKGGQDKSELKTISLFLFTTTQKKLDPQDSNHPEARWVKPDAVAKLLTHPKDKWFFKKILPEIRDKIKITCEKQLYSHLF